MADRLELDGTVATRRRYAYAATTAALFLGYLFLRHSTWRGDIELHTLMETVATVLALAVGCLALVRFYSKKDNTFLFVGTGFVATALLDGYHALVSSSYFIETFPSSPPSLIAWSWFASRMFMSLLLLLSWLFWRREGMLGAAGRIRESLVYAAVAALALLCIAVVALVPLPAAYYREFTVARPQEFVPGLFFLLALIGYLRKGQWKTDAFEHWLVLSLIVAVMGQVLFMSTSGRLYDTMFDAAHLLKVGSYICAMAGLLFGMRRLFSESLAQQQLVTTNTILATQQEVSPDAILVVDEHERIISYNQGFVELWRLPQAMVLAQSDEPVLRTVAAQARDPEAFVARVRFLYEHRTERSHDEIGLQDGRIIDRHSAPVTGNDGRYYGRVWFFRDITARMRAEQAAADERLFSSTLIASQPGVFFVFDARGRFVRWNDKLGELLGFSDVQMVTANPLDTIWEGDRALVSGKLQEAFELGAATIDARIASLRGIRNYIFNARKVETSQGAYLVGVGTDITDRVHAERQIRLFRMLIDSAPDEIHVVDPATLRIIDANESSCVKLGYTREELLALKVTDVDVGDADAHAAIGERLLTDGATTFETLHRRKDGVTFPVEITARLLTLDRPYTVAIARDISERKRADGELRKLQEQLRDQAVHDPLTGLYNRRYLDETMERELIRAGRSGHPIGIVMCDLDHFKVVNDLHGHLAGDDVLRVFADLLRNDSRASDLVCRFGGEEFLLLLPDMPSDATRQRAEKLRAALAAKRIASGTAAIRVTASFGVATFPEDGETMDALIRAADTAMYKAKEAGRNRVAVASTSAVPLPVA